jgi:hypothetical protein
MLTLGNQTLMDRAGQQGDAVPADLITEVLSGDAEGTGAGWLQDIPVQVIPRLRKEQLPPLNADEDV